MSSQSFQRCSCGSNSSSCCSSEQINKQVEIDFLYLDLSVCQRCQGAENNLAEAINEVSGVLKAAGYAVRVNKINVNSRELAMKYEFVSSPTIRINGNDIVLEVNETACQDCGDLCGENVDCRSWVYDGVEYPEPPKAMIIAAILKEVFGGRQAVAKAKVPYVLPENLEVFFSGVESSKNKTQ